MLVLLKRRIQLKLVCGTTVAEFDLVNTMPDIYVYRYGLGE